MPLSPGNSSAVKSHNIEEMMHAGHPRSVAIAAALSNARRHPHKQGGGGVAGGESMEHLADGGFINSSIPGRTDRIPTSVMPDSYVIPADVISGLGQGNSLSGAHLMDAILKTGPYGSNLSPHRSGNDIPRPPAAFKESDSFAKGGSSKKQPVVVAGGEYVVSPVVVMRIGNGSMARGHQLLDQFVNKMRKHHIETLKNLPKPKK